MFNLFEPGQFGAYEMLMDFGFMSILIFLAHILRSKIRLLQIIYMPTSLIAGFSALILGWQFVDFMPFTVRESGVPFMTSYPYLLVVVLFGTLFMGKQPQRKSLKAVVNETGDTFFYNLGSEIGQFGMFLLFGLIILAPLFPGLNQGFALLFPAGFVGGHGYATAIGTVLQNAGWGEAVPIAYTTATIGILSGIIGGMIMINIATRKGWTRVVKTVAELPKSMQTGFVPEKEQQPMGKETVSPIALDPLSWHFALVMVAFVGGYLAYYAIKTLLPGNYEVPMLCTAMLCGVVLQKVLDAMKLGQYVNRHVINRIGSWVTDYLVAFAVASIRIDIVIKYATPMLITWIAGMVWVIGLLLIAGPRLFQNFWFERSIFVYGWNTGVVAMGVTLLRVVDPNFKTKTLENYGFAYTFIAFFEIATVAVVPVLVSQGIILIPALVLFGGFILCMILSRVIVGYSKAGRTAERPGEAEILSETQS